MPKNQWDDVYGSQNIELDLLGLFWFTPKELSFFALWTRWKYKKIEIPKRTWWTRILYSPVFKLKNAQRIILKDILYKKSDSLLIESVTWFVPGKNISDNASYHVAKKFVLKIDIKDFFPSVTQDRIYWLLRKEYDLDHVASMYISSLCCHNNQLPQWAPTSPTLANLIARFLDYKMLWLINTYNKNTPWLNLAYSRYADDLTFSFDKRLKASALIGYIVDIIFEEWFAPNYKKIHLISSGKQQKITWVVVNAKLWVWRKYFKKFKSVFYNISKKWFENELEKWNWEHENSIQSVEKFKQVLAGYLSFIGEISPTYRQKLLDFNVGLN